MNTRVLLALFFLSFALTLYFHQTELAVSVLHLFLVYTFCCFFDAVVAVYMLGRNLKSVSSSVKLESLTWVGRLFGNYQEAHSYRFNTESNDQNALINAPARSSVPDREHSLAEFMLESLAQLDKTFTPLTAAILYLENNTEVVEVIHKGLRGKRFIEQLRLVFHDYFFGKSSKCLGFSDTLDTSFPSEDFSSVGIRFFISEAFSNDKITGILCIGFESERRPQALQQESLRYFARDLERELKTLDSFVDLKALITTAESKSEERSRFLTDISHDIRTPLSNVRTIFSLLQEDLQSVPDGIRLVEIGLKNCEQVDELLESLMDIAKHKTGKLSASKTTFDLYKCAKEVFEAHEVVAKTKNLQISFSSSADQIYCFADRAQIKRVMNNLLGNAIKYTESGNICLSLGSNNLGYCSFRVADSGPGLSEEQLQKLFSPFARFADSHIQGNGLGLALSKILAEANSAKLEVRSEVGLGSVFSFSVPLASATESEKDNHNIAANINKIIEMRPKTYSILDSLKVLVLDDDKDSAESLARYLKRKGANVLALTSVIEGQKLIEQGEFQAVICDCRMPEGGAEKLLRNLAQFKSAPLLIAVSGNLQEAQSLLDLGASCALQKPLDLIKLEDYLFEMFFAFRDAAGSS
jgi:signal transduction histidine kinase